MTSMRHAVLLSVFLVSGVAAAGNKTDLAVTYNATNHSASATMEGARSSSDSLQQIYCSILAVPTAIEGVCTARDAAGVTYSCTTTSPYLIQAIGLISDSSYITFNWDTSGACTAIGVTNGSQYSPKK